ncbi:M1 family aminopeptidase [Thermaurantimonas aggregans]|nr:M1 family aminopeptidase [Thermaurantimonas aggregans]MCX8149825.1 M1 family aminopeptidase [Thermaurantimonas aggregans]
MIGRSWFVVGAVLLTTKVWGQRVDWAAQDSDMVCKRPLVLKSSPWKSGQLSSPLMARYDVVYHRLHFWVNPSILFIQGAATTYVRALQDSVGTLVFDLRNTMTVDSVKSLRTGQSLSYQHQFHQVTIQLGNVLAKGALDSVVIYYRGTPVSTGLGSVGRQSYSFGSAFWTLSQPYGSPDWWPCKDGLTDKIDSIDILITTPLPNRGASLGLLVAESVEGNQHTSYWKHRYPVAPYLVAIAVAPYVVFDQPITLPSNGQSLPFINYVYPTDTPIVYQSVQFTHQVMKLFDTLIAPYPFSSEKYGHARFGWSGGMEHQTMSFMGGWQQDLITHELAHMWFGDLVTCGSWADLWLNEGWAVYLTQLTYEHLKPQQYQAYKINEINKITAQPDGSVYTLDTLNLSRLFSGRLTYSKAGYVLHSLRWLVGDSAFFAGTRNYLNDTSLAYAFALTPQFKAHMESACLCSLTEFFDQWIYGQGYPTYQIIWWQDGDSLRMNISQTTSHPSVPWFNIPLPIRVTDSNQQVHQLRVVVPGASFSYAHYLPQGAAAVVFDPERWLISKNSVSLHISQLRELTPQFSLYPNPGRDQLTLELGSRVQDVRSIVLVFPDGRIVQKISANELEIKDSKVIIPTGTITRGMYIVTVELGDELHHQKWIKTD